jgi:homoserine kinase
MEVLENGMQWSIEVGMMIAAVCVIRSIASGRTNTGSQPSEKGNEDMTGLLLTQASSATDLRTFEHEKKMERRVRRASRDDPIPEERKKVVVKVPATSANLGPGFDTIGMAIDMWSEFTVERSESFEIICEGEGSLDMPLDDSNLICVGIREAFKVAGKPVPTLKYHLKNGIPYARGLGSSSAAIVGGLVAGLVLAGHQVPAWGSETLLQMACSIEGHPDNVAPAIYGGIQLGIYDHDNERWATERVNLPAGLQCVCFIPKKVGKTSTARNLLPNQIERRDAVFNIGRVAWLINALCTNNLDNLRLGTMDALHQPQRAETMYPHLIPLIDAAVKAGACTAYLSGAGPTIMALTSGASGDIFTQRDKERVDRQVAKAMLETAAKYNTDGEVFITKALEHGSFVVSADPPFSKGLVRYSSGV